VGHHLAALCQLRREHPPSCSARSATSSPEASSGRRIAHARWAGTRARAPRPTARPALWTRSSSP
jgi:hypothetical protein